MADQSEGHVRDRAAVEYFDAGGNSVTGMLGDQIQLRDSSNHTDEAFLEYWMTLFMGTVLIPCSLFSLSECRRDWSKRFRTISGTEISLQSRILAAHMM